MVYRFVRPDDGAGSRAEQAGVRSVPGEEPIVSGVIERYALALFELAQENNSVDAISADLKRFAGLVAESDDLALLVRSPVFGADEQVRAVSAVLEKAGIHGLAAKFIALVARNRRLFAILNIIRGYDALVARSRGEVNAYVTTAHALDDAHLAELKDTLRKTTGKTVSLDVKVDPSLIGGLIVKIGSRMVDASLRTKLQSIKTAMKEVG